MYQVGNIILAIAIGVGAAIAGDDIDFDPDFGLEFVTIGDPGNEPYSKFGGELYGDVDYEFRIACTEFNSGQYIDYFNNFLSADPDEFWSLFPNGDSSIRHDGPGIPLDLEQSLTCPRCAPVAMSFVQAAMICNWLHNGQSDDRESLMNGAYEISFEYPIFFTNQAARHPDARYWIPSYSELLKATFYDPDKEGQGPGWWLYPHSSDEPPISGLPGEGHIPRDLTLDELRPVFGGSVRLQTVPLGVYTDVQSPWGLLDTLGGFQEWSETWKSENLIRRLTRSSNNTRTGWTFDEVYIDDASHPRSFRGLRIASAIPSRADLDRDWSVNWYDVSMFIQMYVEGNLSVDLNDDQQLDVNDVLRFLELVG